MATANVSMTYQKHRPLEWLNRNRPLDCLRGPVPLTFLYPIPSCQWKTYGLSEQPRERNGTSTAKFHLVSWSAWAGSLVSRVHVYLWQCYSCPQTLGPALHDSGSPGYASGTRWPWSSNRVNTGTQRKSMHSIHRRNERRNNRRSEGKRNERSRGKRKSDRLNKLRGVRQGEKRRSKRMIEEEKSLPVWYCWWLGETYWEGTVRCWTETKIQRLSPRPKCYFYPQSHTLQTLSRQPEET